MVSHRLTAWASPRAHRHVTNSRQAMVSHRKNEELVVITKPYDLILWSCNHIGKFPRNHRFVLGERIERSLCDLLELLIQAKYSKENRALLDAANLKLADSTGFYVQLPIGFEGKIECGRIIV